MLVLYLLLLVKYYTLLHYFFETYALWYIVEKIESLSVHHIVTKGEPL